MLGGDLVGCFLFAAFLAYSGAFSEQTQSAISEIGRHLMANSPTEMCMKGILAGWLIAALVWMLPSSEGTEIFIITLITYIIAGSVEAI